MAVMLPVCVYSEIKQVMIIPFSHQDIGFTATQNEVENKYIENYNELPSIMNKFEDFKFSVETLWQFEKWLESNPGRNLIDFYIDMEKKGRVEFCAAYGSMHTGFMNYTTLCETFRCCREFRAKYGFDISVCMMNDVPGFCQDLPDIMNKYGISYFIAGVNESFKNNNIMNDTEGLYYWEGPDGGRVLTWAPEKDYMQGITYRSTSEVEEYVRKMEESGYPYDTLPILAAHDNRGFRPGFQAYNNLVRDEFYLDDIKVSLATPSEFFRHVEEKYGDSIPIKKGDWSGWWELTKAGGPYSAGMARYTQQCLEKIIQLDLIDEESDEYNKIIKNLLVYEEHANHGTAGWPGYLTEDQLYESNEKVVEYALESYDTLYTFLDNIMSKKAGIIFKKNVLFNMSEVCSKRIVRFNYNDWSGEKLLLVKINGVIVKAYPFVRNSEDTWGGFEKGYEFYADIPPGFTRFRIVGQESYEADIVDGYVLQNDFYIVRFSPEGFIESVEDKETGQIVGGKYFGSLVKGKHHGWFPDENIEIVKAQSTGIEIKEYSYKKECIISYGEGPIKTLKVELPEYSKEIRFSIDIDRRMFEFVPYQDHSMDYYIEFPLIEKELNIKYSGPDSFVEDYYSFTRHRPFLINVKDRIMLEDSDTIINFASRQAFMANYYPERNSIIYQIAKHYSQCATKDTGITNMRDIEPGLPDVMPFSFYFSSNDKDINNKIDNYINPVISRIRQ